jgi:hypothetical protein
LLESKGQEDMVIRSTLDPPPEFKAKLEDKEKDDFDDK